MHRAASGNFGSLLPLGKMQHHRKLNGRLLQGRPVAAVHLMTRMLRSESA